MIVKAGPYDYRWMELVWIVPMIVSWCATGFNTEFMIFLFFVLVIWLYLRLMNYRVDAVMIENGTLELHSSNLFKMEKSEQYELALLDYKVTEEIVQRGFVRDKVLRIWSGETQIVKIISRQHSWDRDHIRAIVYGLDAAGVAGVDESRD
ncbi:MAG: hypothetical protein JO154_06375 [Chitinophaga sp.]|uniref:hypothetical protein n=1 Tax=Chitinophaga sp. TaxID=1869181 RepID=UPI0025C27D64|nr:hypothetical protein [Chitinophaga sp.]MBV8252218.1 hypothetical protein [Chitinophaga sp.]